MRTLEKLALFGEIQPLILTILPNDILSHKPCELGEFLR